MLKTFRGFFDDYYCWLKKYILFITDNDSVQVRNMAVR